MIIKTTIYGSSISTIKDGCCHNVENPILISTYPLEWSFWNGPMGIMWTSHWESTMVSGVFFQVFK